MKKPPIQVVLAKEAPRPGKYGPVELRYVLADLGVNPSLATMVTPNLFFTPGESDPSAQNTMVIVQGIQKCLNKLGFNLPRNGLMTPATQNAIAQVVGRNWLAVPWLHIYEVLTLAKRRGMKPGKVIPTWKQQNTAIGESVSLGATTTPLDQSFPYTIPSTQIDCVGSGTAEYCYGKTAAVTAAFKKLQATVGVAQDGRVGPVTARTAASKAKSLWYDRFNKRVTASEADYLAQVFQAWEKYQRPFVIAASADKMAAILAKYLGMASRLLSAVTAIFTKEEAAPPPPDAVDVSQAGFGSGMFAVVGLGALAAWYFLGKKKSSKSRRR